MTKIVFACKSNSCRSQMAEGWAKDWIRRRRDELDREERLAFDGNAVVDVRETIDGAELSRGDEVSTGLKVERKISRTVVRRRSNLDSVVVTSVALDSSSVFECTTGQCCGDVCETPAQRKAVKAKAVKAMKLDGIDISSFVPKTIEEILPSLVNSSDSSKKQVISDIAGSTLEGEESTIDELSASYSSTLFRSEDRADAEKKIVDKLIVMCSCGDAVKRKLVRRSRSVEEWNVDAPTAASKSGEGDSAYRRVSLEIRDEVNILMNSLFLEDGEDVLDVSVVADEKKDW